MLLRLYETDISEYVSLTNISRQHLPTAQKPYDNRCQKKFPFLEYATHQVLYHANAAAIELPQDDFLKTFDLQAWINLDNLFEKFEIRRHTLSASLPYILAENNFASLINSMLCYDSKVHINGSDTDIPYSLLSRMGIEKRSGLSCSWTKRHLVKAALLCNWITDGISNLLRDRHRYHGAAKNGHREVVQLLLSQGTNIESKDRFSRTPLLWAAQNRYTEVVRLLLSQGADLESKDSFSQTPLLWAAQNGHTEVVRLLLSQGVDLESKIVLAKRRYYGLLRTDIQKLYSYCLARVPTSSQKICLAERRYYGLLRTDIQKLYGYCLAKVPTLSQKIVLAKRRYYGLLRRGMKRLYSCCLPMAPVLNERVLARHRYRWLLTTLKRIYIPLLWLRLD